MYQGPMALSDAIRRQSAHLRRPLEPGDVLIVRVEENGVDVKMLDDKELDTLCRERRRP